jgi:hypothetical protein
MLFSWWAFGLTEFWVMVMAVSSWRDGTLLGRQKMHVNIPFVWHWGMSWTVIILGIVNGLAFPYINAYLLKDPILGGIYLLVISVLSAPIAYGLTRMWWPQHESESCPAQVFQWRSRGEKELWHKDLMPTGVIFTLYLVLQIEMGIGVFFTPIPSESLKWIAYLSAICPWLGILEPTVMATWEKDDLGSKLARGFSAVICLALDAAIYILYLCKA